MRISVLVLAVVWAPIFYGQKTVDWTDSVTQVRCPYGKPPPDPSCVELKIITPTVPVDTSNDR